MIKATRIVFLSCLFTSVSLAAMAVPSHDAKVSAPQASAATQPAPPTQAQLRAMSTLRLLRLGQKALDSEMDTQDFATGLDAAKIASSRGDREATRLMAKIMARHEVALQGIDRARLERRLRFEALRGASSSVLAVAGMYDRGEGVPADTRKAAEWYLWAARVGHERAMAYAAYAYGTGRGLERSEAAALKWLDGVNEGRRRSTLLEIGWALALGTEGVTDMASALRFFGQAAQLKPGIAYQVALDLERGTRGIQNRDAAGQLIKVAAERGDSAAAMHMASALSGSSNVEDQRQAVQWYSLAALDKTNLVAGQTLARLLALRPSDELISLIVAGLDKAAEAGNSEALIGLAHAYADGIGLSASPEKAVSLLQAAADSGIPEAKYRLGLMYKSGTGVTADLNKAIELISSARESGFPLAAVALRSITESEMTSSVDDTRNGPSGAPNAVAQ
ncbi:SEL1-like repeat protein [Microvirga sp. VF16]|uniref:tetratricopeptide repeat protein n=1 Tax=Microvirga sp. VF16 TaxID=2807101 RepID=UPI00193E69D2|nr:SEL1-like repeat protein [Microvirga sp. VF16]QRM30606.1 sel1 repeat family protein [Microvirga sp. VF16]